MIACDLLLSTFKNILNFKRITLQVLKLLFQFIILLQQLLVAWMCRLNMLQHLLWHILKLVMQFLPIVKPLLSLFCKPLNLLHWNILRLKFGSQGNNNCSETRYFILTLAIFEINNCLTCFWNSFKMLFFNCLRVIKSCCLRHLNGDFTTCPSLHNDRILHYFLREIKQSLWSFYFSVLLIICWVLVLFTFVISDCFRNFYCQISIT